MRSACALGKALRHASPLNCGRLLCVSNLKGLMCSACCRILPSRDCPREALELRLRECKPLSAKRVRRNMQQNSIGTTGALRVKLWLRRSTTESLSDMRQRGQRYQRGRFIQSEWKEQRSIWDT